jgi:hypothetical protein
MKNLYLLGGIAVVALVLIGLGSWYLNQSNSASAPTISTTAATSTAQQPSVAKSKTKSNTTHTTTTTTTTVTTTNPPKILLFAQPSAAPGLSVTIVGTGFDATQNAILFGPSGGRHRPDGSPDNQIATVGSPDGKTLSFTVPTSGPSGMLCDSTNHCVAVSAIRIIPGQYAVIVKNRNGESNSSAFTVIAQ